MGSSATVSEILRCVQIDARKQIGPERADPLTAFSPFGTPLAYRKTSWPSRGESGVGPKQRKVLWGRNREEA